jgi:hypothetical protein
MTVITDNYMREMLTKTKGYTLVLIKDGPNRHRPDADAIIWEHGRRNFGLRADGVLAIVCPVSDRSPLDGLYIFDAPVDEVRRLMDDDPGVKVGLFVYEVHETRGFPGDTLPA